MATMIDAPMPLLATVRANQIYQAAADALTDGNLATYQDLRAQYDGLGGWAGHDQRAARLAGHAYAGVTLDLGGPDAPVRPELEAQDPDPLLVDHLAPARRPAPIPVEKLDRCKKCKTVISWSETDEGNPSPYNVLPGGYGTRKSHVDTCPNAKEFRDAEQAKATKAPRKDAA